MLANQKSIGSNGYENLLFPLEYMQMTQGEHSSTYYAMDFSGWGESGKIEKCPYYAPCSCTVVYLNKSTSNPYVIWQSNNKVNYIDGTLDYVYFLVGHDNNIADFNLGDTRSQGELLGHTGNLGLSTGDHLHLYLGKGEWGNGQWILVGEDYRFKTQYHIYNAMGVNNTVLEETGGYNWRDFSITPSKKKSIIPLSLCNALKWSI